PYTTLFRSRGYRTDHARFFLGTKSDYSHFIKCFDVADQFHLGSLALPDKHFLVFITHKGENQDGFVPGNIQHELSLQVGIGSLLGTLDQNRYAGQTSAGKAVGNHPGQSGMLLGFCTRPTGTKERRKEKKVFPSRKQSAIKLFHRTSGLGAVPIALKLNN